MDIRHAIELIKKITYKPGYTIEVLNRPWGPFSDSSLHLSVAWNPKDSSYPPFYERTTSVSSRIDIAEWELMAFDTDDALYRVVLARLIDTEIHEAREFFKVGNIQPGVLAEGTTFPMPEAAATYETPFHPHEQAGNDRWSATNRWGTYKSI